VVEGEVLLLLVLQGDGGIHTEVHVPVEGRIVVLDHQPSGRGKQPGEFPWGAWESLWFPVEVFIFYELGSLILWILLWDVIRGHRGTVGLRGIPGILCKEIGVILTSDPVRLVSVE
jgi:hypothetical protein